MSARRTGRTGRTEPDQDGTPQTHARRGRPAAARQTGGQPQTTRSKATAKKEGPARTAQKRMPSGPQPVDKWALGNGEVLHIADGADLLSNRVHADLRFARGTVWTVEGEPVRTPTGEPLRLTAFRQRPKNTWTEDASEPATKVLWEGVIWVSDSRLAYEITPDRVIDAESGVRTVSVSSTDSNNNTRHLALSVAVSRKQTNTEWLDPLGIVAVDSPAMVGKYIRALADGLPDPGSSVYGQGPIRTPDGDLLLVTSSGCYGTDGELVPGWKADLSTLNPVYLRGMHDVMPDPDPAAVKAGIGYLLDLLALSSEYPEVPAAHIGQLMVSVLTPVDARYFTAIWLHAKAGCGKTYFETLISAIQSPSMRDLPQINPELNLGDVTGTTKGPKYRVPAFGLGTITADDVFKAVHSPQVQMQRTEMADALIRSYEGGAAAIGTVDKARNRVGSKASGQLCASIRMTAEGPPPARAGAESSTADRVILQGGWQTPWQAVFSSETFKKLTEKDALEAMYAAYSHITRHVWSHQAETGKLYDEASTVTAGWVMGSERVRSRYTPAVAGLFVLRDRAEDFGYDRTCVDRAVKALEDAAMRQTAPENAPDLVAEFRSELRLALRDGAVAGVGRPVRATGESQGTYISPYRSEPDPQDGDLRVWTWPDGVEDPSALGLKIDGAHARPKRDNAVELYVRPPQRTAQGGRNRSTQHRWSLLAPTSTGTFESLCRALTDRRKKTDGMLFESAQVIEALTKTDASFKAKVRFYAEPSVDQVGTEDSQASTQACIVIPTAWLFEPEPDETEN